MATTGRMVELFGGYIGGAVVSAVTGAVVAWLSGQKNPRLLFIYGMLGMTILTTLFGKYLQPKTGWILENPFSITAAYAQDADRCVGDTAFAKGFKAFFGTRDAYNKWAVVVASGKSRTEAQAKLKAIGEQDPTLKLRVGPRACDSDFYPVLASEYLEIDDARPLLTKAKRVVSDAYLSPGPK